MELRVIVNPLNGTGPARALLSNLFYAGGYNFYRRGSGLCADDLLIRGKVAELLQESCIHLSGLEAAFRIRMRPFAGPPTAATIHALEGAQRDLEAMSATVRNTELGELEHFPPDRREEPGILRRLVTLDGEALLALVTLRDAIMRFDDGAAAAAGTPNLLRVCDFNALWSRREALLSADCA